MGFKKGESGNKEGRPKGSLNKTTKDIREFISKAPYTDKIIEMLNQISNPTDYINAVSKLLPYVAGKVKLYRHPRSKLKCNILESIDIYIPSGFGN